MKVRHERPGGSDLRLVEAARSGDLEAFAELVRRYERRVRSVLLRLLPDERDVEEAAQDVFVQAWRSLDRFRGDASVFTWLYRIAVNEALMRRRRRRPPLADLGALPEAELADKGVDAPEEAAQASDLRAFLLARVRALPFQYRAPLALRDIEGLSNQQVADVLGISLAAAKSRVHRARMQLRSDLEARERELGGEA